MNKKLKIVMIGIVILIISGCVQAPKEQATPTATATVVPTTTVIPVPTATVMATAQMTPVVTPVPTTKQLPPGTFFISARFETPVYWSPGNYELKAFRVEVSNQISIPLTVEARVISNGQILEVHPFVLQDQGSKFSFDNEKGYYVNNTNLILRLSVPGYDPVDYNFTEVRSFR